MFQLFNGATFGNAPFSTFAKSSDNAYYATTSAGGDYGYGTIVKICGGVTTVLHSFNKTTDGAYPKGKLLLANDGNFYGLASDGGSKNAGTIFKLTISGNFSVDSLQFPVDFSTSICFCGQPNIKMWIEVQ